MALKRSRIWTAVLLVITAVIVAGLAVTAFNDIAQPMPELDVPMFLKGEYSVDDGSFKLYDGTRKTITDKFHKIVIRGRLVEDVLYSGTITVSSKNVWYTLKNSDGVTMLEHQPIDIEKEYRDFVGLSGGLVTDGINSVGDYISTYYPLQRQQVLLTKTPGYWVQSYYTGWMDANDKEYNDTYTLEVVYPYDYPTAEFNDCFDVDLYDVTSHYKDFFFNALPPILLFVLVCFFGVFFFPIANFILGKTDYKYLVFGLMLFSWGLFMIMQTISGYLNMWIADSTVCMLLHGMTNYILIISILFYLKSNLKIRVYRMWANVLVTLYLAAIIAVAVLHLTGTADLQATSPYMFICTAVGAVAVAGLLLLEIHDNRSMYIVLAAWIPLAATVIIDAVNHYLNFTTFDFYTLGLAVTMVYQLVRLVLDLRRQYKETIRFQQMQKELYEAKVSVMVSQIQPHFMYNALSSIAMLCKINPDTAYDATIAFSDYLRGNMDSLKQTAPVPFEKELEHLKKYLYIEQLRFGKKLNIVYDIQATDFEIPLLSVQPLVENAVKHGVGMKKKGGTVTIASRETGDSFEVVITDNGVGFDTSAPKKDDGRSHVGMDNTKRRLRDMCGGEVIIESTPGEGTVARIVIPKSRDES